MLVVVDGADIERLESLLGGDQEVVVTAMPLRELADWHPGEPLPTRFHEADVIALPESVALAGRTDTNKVRTVAVPPGASLPDGRLELWLAAELSRAIRRIPQPELHASPGLTRVLTEGSYDHPQLAPGIMSRFGVLLFKPATIVTAEVLDDLARRAGECGYSVVAARSLTPAELVASGAVRRHYAAHWEIAQAGRLQPDERLRLLRIYDRPQFDDRFGIAASDVPVFPVLEFASRSAIPLDTINEWSEASANAHGLNSGCLDGPNEVGDLTYANLFEFPDRSASPVFLLNPHMPSVTTWFEHSPTPLVALLLGTADDEALPWARMRAEFCGGSDPSTAPLGSLRRDMWEGFWPLRYVDEIEVGRAYNGVHLSNGPVESVREAAIWFEIAPEETATGRTLLAACGGKPDFLHAEYLCFEGRTRVLVDVTRDLSTAEAARVLAAGKRLAIREQVANDATIRRVDLAHRIGRELADADDVVAVLVGGSVARNRASGDSDLDLIVITSRPERSQVIERMERSGVVVEVEWLVPEDAFELAAGGHKRDVRELRRSARLGLALAVHDPDGIADELASRARAARPDLASAGERLVEAYGTFVALVEGSVHDTAECWSAVRGLYDVIAFLLLLAGPLRYQKPKWVLADLDETGNGDVAAALMRAYGVDDDRAAAADAIESASRAIEVTAAELGLPTSDTVRQLGLVAAYPEYSYVCHSVDDARSLLMDGRFADAAYAAKFSVQMMYAISEGSSGTIDSEPGARNAELDHLASSLFAHDVTPPPVEDSDLESCLAHLERCRARLLPSDEQEIITHEDRAQEPDRD